MRYTAAFMEKSELRDFATDAIKFWEQWRLVYNLTLAAIVIISSRSDTRFQNPYS